MINVFIGRSSRFGTLEIVTAPLQGSHPDPVLLQRLSDLVRAGGIQILDFAITTLTPTGAVSWSEVDEDEFSLAGLKLKFPGFIAEQDFKYVLNEVGVGEWAIVLVEHTWSYPETPYQVAGARVIAIATVSNEIAESVLEIVSDPPLQSP